MPTMPRHHYKRVKPLVEELCAKHGITYRSKTLLGEKPKQMRFPHRLSQ
jgi:hypothetical protein